MVSSCEGGRRHAIHLRGRTRRRAIRGRFGRIASAQKIKDGAEEQAKKLEAMVIKIGAKVGESGKIYGSVNALQLADALSKLGVVVDRKKIHLDSEHIKTLGEYHAVVNLHKDVKAKVTFEVVAE